MLFSMKSRVSYKIASRRGIKLPLSLDLGSMVEIRSSGECMDAGERARMTGGAEWTVA
jgi:hypothetical protein